MDAIVEKSTQSIDRLIAELHSVKADVLKRIGYLRQLGQLEEKAEELPALSDMLVADRMRRVIAADAEATGPRDPATQQLVSDIEGLVDKLVALRRKAIRDLRGLEETADRGTLLEALREQRRRMIGLIHRASMPDDGTIVEEAIARLRLDGFQGSLMRHDTKLLREAGVMLVRGDTVQRVWSWINEAYAPGQKEPAIPDKAVYGFARRLRPEYAALRDRYAGFAAKEVIQPRSRQSPRERRLLPLPPHDLRGADEAMIRSAARMVSLKGLQIDLSQAELDRACVLIVGLLSESRNPKQDRLERAGKGRVIALRAWLERQTGNRVNVMTANALIERFEKHYDQLGGDTQYGRFNALRKAEFEALKRPAATPSPNE